MRFSTIVLAPLAVGSVSAICPGFNFGIGNQIKPGGILSQWNVYNDDCKIVETLTTNKNPCNAGIFGCSPAPIHFNRYTNTKTGLKYACRPDPRSGKCGNDKIGVCCRNDGN